MTARRYGTVLRCYDSKNKYTMSWGLGMSWNNRSRAVGNRKSMQSDALKAGLQFFSPDCPIWPSFIRPAPIQPQSEPSASHATKAMPLTFAKTKTQTKTMGCVQTRRFSKQNPISATTSKNQGHFFASMSMASQNNLLHASRLRCSLGARSAAPGACAEEPPWQNQWEAG